MAIQLFKTKCVQSAYKARSSLVGLRGSGHKKRRVRTASISNVHHTAKTAELDISGIHSAVILTAMEAIYEKTKTTCGHNSLETNDHATVRNFIRMPYSNPTITGFF